MKEQCNNDRNWSTCWRLDGHKTTNRPTAVIVRVELPFAGIGGRHIVVVVRPCECVG